MIGGVKPRKPPKVKESPRQNGVFVKPRGSLAPCRNGRIWGQSRHETHPSSCPGAARWRCRRDRRAVAWIYRMKTYAGPVSDHFDGERFFDPDGMPPKSLTRGAALAVRPRPAARGLAGLGAEPACRHAAGARRRRQGAAVVRRTCQLADPDRRAEYPGRSGVVDARLAVQLWPVRSGTTIPALRSTRCPRSTSCWCRMAITIIWTLRRSRSWPRNSRRA